MENTTITSDKVFLGFGILTVICGILLIIEKNYLTGISGSIVGIGLAVQNFQKIKEKNKA